LQTIKPKKQVVRKESINGICGKKLRQVFGKKIAITIRNGIILFQIPNNNRSKNRLYLKMIQISEHFNLTYKKEKEKEKKIQTKRKD
jgi:hypothetical protein